MSYLTKNNAYSTLASSILSSDGSLTLQAGHGDRFPIIVAPDFTYVTLEDVAGNIEIVKVTARASASNVLTIQRAQDGTAARAWASGDVVELRLISALLQQSIAHPAETANAHAATAISVAAAGSFAIGTVQSILAYLDGLISTLSSSITTALSAHITDTSDAHDASAISYIPTGTITASNVQAALTELDSEKASAATLTALVQAIYPIGAIYISTHYANPNILLGFGTWAVFAPGRTLVSLDPTNPLMYASGITFGQADQVNVAHSHNVNDPGHSHVYTFKSNTGGTTAGGDPNSVINANANTAAATTGITIEGSGVFGENLNYQPSIAVYMWKRIA